VGHFITSCPELLLGFVLKVEDNILLPGFVRQAETAADSDLQPIAPTSCPTCSNTFVGSRLILVNKEKSPTFIYH